MMNPNYLRRPTAAELLQLKSFRNLAKCRRIFCAYRKIVIRKMNVVFYKFSIDFLSFFQINALNNFILLFWMYALCFAKFSLRKPFSYSRFFLRYKTKPSSLIVNGTTSSGLTGIKRKHVVLTPENDVSSPFRMARLSFSDLPPKNLFRVIILHVSRRSFDESVQFLTRFVYRISITIRQTKTTFEGFKFTKQKNSCK